MKVTDVRVQSFQHSVPPEWAGSFGGKLETTLVTVVTDQGIEGYGMGRSTPGAPGAILGQEVAAVARPLVVGEEAFDREKIWLKLWRLVRRVRLSTYALSCIDVALWDVAGKALNTPVYRLIGGARDRVPAYASSGHHTRVETYPEEALAYKAKGFTAYKLHPLQDPQKDVAASRAVRKAVGDEMALMIDPAGAYDHREAMWVGRRLEELNFYWYEEPVGDYDLYGYAELCRALDIPILANEVVPGSIYSAAEFIMRGATDIMRADVYWKGGITAVMKIAHLAEAFGLKLEVHHGASGVMDWANLHCLGAFKNGDYMEILVPQEGLEHGLQAYPHADAEGYVHLPQTPGLGAVIDWDFVNAHTTFKA